MKKLLITLLIGIFLISFASAVNLSESYITGDDTAGGIGGADGNVLQAQTFKVGSNGVNTSLNLINISLKLYRIGTPGNINVFIMGLNGSDYPDTSQLLTGGNIDGDSLTTNTNGAWYNITMNTTISLIKGQRYAIVLNATNSAGDQGAWRSDSDNSGGAYPSGDTFSSTDAGGSFENSSSSNMFELWGNSTVDIIFNNPTPTNNEQILAGSNIINITVNGFSNELRNITLWVNGTLNETITTTDNINTSLFIKSFSRGARSIYINTCLDTGSCFNSTTRVIDVRDWIEHQKYSPASTLVGNTENFGVQLNLSSGTTITGANFVYGDNVYSTTITGLGSDNYNITRNLIIPTDTGTIWNYFNFTLSSGDLGVSTNSSLTSSSLGVDACGVYTFELYNFTMYDEQTLNNIDFTNTTINGTINLQIYDGTKAVNVVNFSNTYTNSTDFRVCLENNLTDSSDYIIDLELQYLADGYAKEFYNIWTDALTVSDIGTKIGLYDLVNSSSQEFKLTYRDASFLPVENAVIQVQRKYVGEGLFRTVEQPKTNAKGETLLHLETDDVVYTFVILRDGAISSVFNNIIAVCQNPLLSECEIDLIDAESFVETQDFSLVDDFAFTGLTFNRTTRILSTIFTIVSGTSDLVSLNVTLFDGLGTTDVCSQAVTSSSGTLSCTVPNSFGNSTIVASLYKGGQKVAENIISLAQDPSELYGNNIVIVAFIIFIGLIGIGISGNPVIMGVFLIFISILLVTMNIVYSTGFIGASATILWFIIAVIIILIKGANRV